MSPTVSPDGSTLAFVRVDEGDDPPATFHEGIYLMDADGANLREILRTGEPMPVSVRGLAWSPDGSRIAFAGISLDGDRYRSDVFVMNADGSEARRLTDDGISWTPAWSPDGASIAFKRWIDQGLTHVYRLSVADPGDVTPVWTGDGAFDSLAWSPDGGAIAIAALFRDNPDCRIVSVPLDGSTTTPLLVSERPPPFGDAETSLCAGSLTWAPHLDVDG